MQEIVRGLLEKSAVGGEKVTLEEGIVKGAQELEQMCEAAGLELDITPLVFEGKEDSLVRKGGLAACSWKCIMSHCYPVDIAKKINSDRPHGPNSSLGHSK